MISVHIIILISSFLFELTILQQINWLFHSVFREAGLIGQIEIGINVHLPIYYFRTYFEGNKFVEDIYGWSVIDYPFKWQEIQINHLEYVEFTITNLTSHHGRLSKRGFYSDNLIINILKDIYIVGKSFILYDLNNQIITSSIILPLIINYSFKVDFNGLFEGQLSIIQSSFPNKYNYQNNIDYPNILYDENYSTKYDNQTLTLFLFDLMELDQSIFNHNFQLILANKGKLRKFAHNNSIIGIEPWDILNVTESEWYDCYTMRTCQFIDMHSITETPWKLHDRRFSLVSLDKSLDNIKLCDYSLIILKSSKFSSLHEIIQIEKPLISFSVTGYNVDIKIEQKDHWFPVYFIFNGSISQLEYIEQINPLEPDRISKNNEQISEKTNVSYRIIISNNCSTSYPLMESIVLMDLNSLFGNNHNNYAFNPFKIALNFSLLDFNINLVYNKFLSIIHSYDHNINFNQNDQLQIQRMSVCSPFVMNDIDSTVALTTFQNNILDGQIKITQIHQRAIIFLFSVIEINLKYLSSRNKTCCHNWHIHELSNHYNPMNINTKSDDYLIKCSKHRQNQCEIGDLNNKHGQIEIGGRNYEFFDFSISFFGIHSIINRTICIHSNEQSKLIIECSPIAYIN